MLKGVVQGQSRQALMSWRRLPGRHLRCRARLPGRHPRCRPRLPGRHLGCRRTIPYLRHHIGDAASYLQALSFGRGPPGPLVNGGLRPPGGVVSVRPKAMSRPRKAAGLLKSPVRSPSSSAARGPDGG